MCVCVCVCVCVCIYNILKHLKYIYIYIYMEKGEAHNITTLLIKIGIITYNYENIIIYHLKELKKKNIHKIILIEE